MNSYIENFPNLTFGRISYLFYNKLDEEYLIKKIENEFNEKFTIDDFEIADILKTDKEKFLLKLHNKEIINQIKEFEAFVNKKKGYTFYLDKNNGYAKLVRLKQIAE